MAAPTVAKKRIPKQQRQKPGATRWLAIGCIVLGVLVIAAFAGSRLIGGSKAGIAGATINGSPPAPDFTLTDQNGKQINLHDYKGKVVALTFLYTHCKDVCPLIAGNMAQADRQLGSGQGQVEMLAVSVDPSGDTPPSIHKFDDDRGLADLGNWHYLTGSPSQLAKVWSNYGGTNPNNPDGTKQLTPEQLDHMSIIYLIDGQGHMRAALPANFTVPDLLQDLHALQ